MTNEIGKSMFSKAGELGVPVGFMCMKVRGSLLALLQKAYGFYCRFVLTRRIPSMTAAERSYVDSIVD